MGLIILGHPEHGLAKIDSSSKDDIAALLKNGYKKTEKTPDDFDVQTAKRRATAAAIAEGADMASAVAQGDQAATTEAEIKSLRRQLAAAKTDLDDAHKELDTAKAALIEATAAIEKLKK